jgi:hypothetical protein
MNEDERRVHAILSFTFRKLDEELDRFPPRKCGPSKKSKGEDDGEEQAAENPVLRDLECS